ncbi:Protein saf4 [Escovopsis weberi]|uniref:Protein saf4 n=1 Tax=Escovopsis weberi TaxID=150374 RepID=A0A0M9VXA7_ESCWE|nr:Protein saf4 [Escovopsis weberi]
MQGFNMGRYVPPDVEGTISANALHGKQRRAGAHATPTVRFEMPFAAWCATCPRPTLIPQGVRFNAEKRRAGSYFSTPVWSFAFRHAECGGRVEVRTDPQNTAYVITSGATPRGRNDARPEGLQGGGAAGAGALLTDAERAAQRSSAFASLERTIEDRAALHVAARRIDGLRGLAARDWDDPYARNQALRRAFRAGRRERERRAAEAHALRARLALGDELPILPETEDDRRRAALVEFGGGGGGGSTGDAALARPLFNRAEKTGKGGLVSELVSNTRAAQDPFLQARGDRTPRAVLGVKRKQTAAAAAAAAAPDPSSSAVTRGPSKAAAEVRLAEDPPLPPPSSSASSASSVQTSTVSGALVAYDSEDE